MRSRPTGLRWTKTAFPAEKLKVTQKLMEQSDPRAEQVYASIGCYLGHTLAYYFEHYGFRHVLLLGETFRRAGQSMAAASLSEMK